MCKILKTTRLFRIIFKAIFVLSVFLSFSNATAITLNNTITIPGTFLVKYGYAPSSLMHVDAIKTIKRTGAPGIVKIVMNQQLTQAEGQRILSAQPGVEIVEPLKIFRGFSRFKASATTPNDPDLNQQWHHDMIETPAAWDVTMGSSNVVVAVIDTGVDYKHEDLKNSMWVNITENTGTTWWDDDGNGFEDDIYGYDFVDLTGYMGYIFNGWMRTVAQEDYLIADGQPLDTLGHGTHVAGIIAAEAGNGTGGAGVAPGVKIMALRAGYRAQELYDGTWHDGGWFTSEGIINSIVYAKNNGARIINMSFGGEYDEIIEDLLRKAYEQGIVLVAAAGNSGSPDKQYPAGYDFVIAVGAVNSVKAKASFSNFGSWVDIAAPGTYIYSTISSPNGYGAAGNYDSMSGTSMASPIVAGIAALVLSVSPTMSPAGVDYALKRGSLPYNYGYDIGIGITNARKTINNILSPTTTSTGRIIKKVYVTPNPVNKSEGTYAQIKILFDTFAARINCRIYDVQGQLVYNTQKDNIFADSIYSILWDKKSNWRVLLPTGVYYLITEAWDEKGNKDTAKTKIAVVN